MDVRVTWRARALPSADGAYAGAFPPLGSGNLAGMDENRARRVTDALRDLGINAHLHKSGIDEYSVQVSLSGGREAIWGSEDTTGLEAEVLLDGDLVGFVPQIPGSEGFDEAQIVDAIARADYDQPVGRERAEAPPPGPALSREGGLFRRFLEGFREEPES
jgi:hypothetical protein